MTIYTSIIIIGLNKYEARIKDYKKAISDYKRALDLSRDNKYSQQHYTQLQLEAKQLRMSLYELDKDNHLLKQQLAQSKQQVLESRPLQYESNVYHPSLFESQVDFE
jgi:multidrug resistance efflux pump